MDDFRMTKLGRLAASGLLSDRTCLVFSICGIGISAATNVFKIYDGFGITDRQVMTLGGIQYQSDFRGFSSPLFFAKGIYVDFTTNGTELFVQYVETDE